MSCSTLSRPDLPGPGSGSPDLTFTLLDLPAWSLVCDEFDHTWQSSTDGWWYAMGDPARLSATDIVRIAVGRLTVVHMPSRWRDIAEIDPRDLTGALAGTLFLQSDLLWYRPGPRDAWVMRDAWTTATVPVTGQDLVRRIRAGQGDRRVKIITPHP